jgi:fermentation-respiration switch protein FrsA (DUF1100 family)
MKKTILILFTLFTVSTAFGQNVINLFNKSNDFFYLLDEKKFTDAYALFDDSTKTKISEDNLKTLWTSINTKLGATKSIDAVRSSKEGEYIAITSEGKFENGDQNFILVFNKAEKIVGLWTPPTQTKAVYNLPTYADTTLYKESSIYVKSDKHQLAGILTIPKKAKNYPIVVFVHGSGPSDMDESVGANKPFKDIAIGLAAKGIASIRYVKRTLVYAHEFTNVFTLKEEVLDDAATAIALAKATPGINPKAVYLFGHSLGGMLAPRISVASPGLAGIILAAAPARKLTDIIIDQNKYAFEKLNDTTAKAKEMLNSALKEIEKTRVGALGTAKPDSVLLGLPLKYWIDLNSNDQVATLKKISGTRAYIANGAFDFQVPQTDFELWKAAVGKKSNVTLKLYPQLNHLLSIQTEKGTAAQYQIPNNVSEEFINDIATWIKAGK